MTTDDEVLEKAGAILSKYSVGEIMVELKESWYRFESTKSVILIGYGIDVKVNDDIKNGVVLVSDGHTIIVGFSDFRSSSAPDDSTSYASAYIYYDRELVLHTDAIEDYGEYGNIVSVQTYPSSLKSFSAGPWLDLLGRCHDELTRDAKQREEEKRQEKVANQVSKIDLGDYE